MHLSSHFTLLSRDKWRTWICNLVYYEDVTTSLC